MTNRRQFLKLINGALAAGQILRPGFAAAPPQAESMVEVRYPAMNPRLGIIGTGGRGTSLMKNLLAADARVNAVCDIVREKAENAASIVRSSGQNAPTTYTDGERAFEKLCARDDLDLVLIATPWRWHTEMAVTAMRRGKHVAVEVPAATSIEECWKLVDTSEQTRRHCVMLENCCYGYNELLVLNMIRDGLFGDLLHGEAAYLHDLRDEMFSNKGEGLWRRTVHTERNGNLYPTHGLGPVANYMDINRGDSFNYLVSMSSPQRGLDEFRKQHVPAGDPKWKEKYVTGDINTSLIKTANGLTIMLQHDVSNPHPYDRLNLIQGTKGLFRDYPPRIYFDGQSGPEEWTGIDAYKAKYEHPLWKNEGTTARKLGGHGGMDFLMCYRLLQCIREGSAPDMDVYDAAAWSAPGPLSEASVAQGSVPLKFPDFTRGRWKSRPKTKI